MSAGAGAVVVLTASAERGLWDADIAAAARELGLEAETPRRLGPAGAEIGVSAPPECLPALPGIDVNVVPAVGRRKRLLIADMDATMIPVECIDEVAYAAGVGPKVAEITEAAMAGELDFEGALRARVALLEGLAEATLEAVYDARVALNPGGRTLVRTMAEAGAATALVSGGFTFFAERVGRAAGFAETQANRLLAAEGRLTGRVAEPILGRAAKLEAMSRMLARDGLTPSEACALGDGANDLAMIEAAGLGVGFRPKPALAARADAVIRHGDLTAVLHLQGIHADQFVRD